MPRKPRPIHTERVYHVFNRCNYKLPLFEQDGAIAAFLEAMFETTVRFKWEVYAYAIMPNHYHLCIRTPDANLSAGMHRLLSAFSIRFNRYHGVSGHVFQGRFKAVVAPKGISVRRIIDYIHLNRVRAGLQTIDQASVGIETSLSAYMNPDFRAQPLAVDAAFARFVGHQDTPQGRISYLQDLRQVLACDADGSGFKSDWECEVAFDKAEMRRAAGPIRPERRMTCAETKALAELKWEELARVLLSEEKLNDADLPGLTKSHPSKLRMAHALRIRTGASFAWIALRLHAGTGESLRVQLHKTKGSDP